MKIKPINGVIVLKLDEEAEKTDTGLLVPSVKGERSEAYAIRGEVIAIADDLPLELSRDYSDTINNTQSEEYIDLATSPKVKIGDKVLAGKWDGQKTTLNGENLILIKQKDIWAILE